MKLFLTIFGIDVDLTIGPEKKASEAESEAEPEAGEDPTGGCDFTSHPEFGGRNLDPNIPDDRVRWFGFY